MPASGPADPLLTALAELSALGGDQERALIDGLRGRLAGQRLRVLVAGEAKRGKSTLVNALLGRAVLPAGVTPLTSLATTVRHGTHEGVTAVFASGRAEEFPLSALDDLVTERGNPDNRKHLSSVTARVSAPLLARGVELVDTPGTGSVYGHNTAEAEAALTAMDAAVFVLTADPPVSASECELIARVARLSVAMFVVLNKADHLSGSELQEVMEFTAEVVARAAGHPVRVYPASARAALSGSGDPGFAAFVTDFAGYLERGSTADLRRSAQGHARRLASSLRDEVLLARRAAHMRNSGAAERVQAFAARLAAVRDRRRDAADLVAGESRRMLADLNEAAELAGREGARRVSRHLTGLLDGALRSASAAEIERAGRAKLAELAVAEAEAWRRDRTGKLEARLRLLDENLTGILRTELEAVRWAAADLLGLDLAIPAPGQHLVADLRFFYHVAEQAGQTELLAGAIRRRLPGEAGRHRAREHLRRESSGLVPMQIGRARADLQYRLAEASRRLAREIDARYQEATGRLEKALADAGALGNATAVEVTERDCQLAERRGAIDRVLGVLDLVTPSTAGPAGPAAQTAAAVSSRDTPGGGRSAAR